MKIVARRRFSFFLNVHPRLQNNFKCWAIEKINLKTKISF